MGMHFGFVVADVPASRLVAVLDELAPQFVDHGPIASVEEIEPAAETGWELAIGELGDRSCLLDGSFMLSSDADLIARVASKTGGLVIGCGAETVSGTYYFIVARGDRLLRHYYHCYSDMTEPYSSGNAVPGENPEELDDIDGGGLLAVAAAHGLDYDKWYETATKRKLVWSARDMEGQGPLPWWGAEHDALAKHREQHKHPPGKEPKIGLMVREVAPARQLFDEPASGPKKPWWRFW